MLLLLLLLPYLPFLARRPPWVSHQTEPLKICPPTQLTLDIVNHQDVRNNDKRERRERKRKCLEKKYHTAKEKKFPK